jgi:hypothetical protein
MVRPCTARARRPATKENSTIYSNRMEKYRKTSKEIDKSDWCHKRLVPLLGGEEEEEE